MSEDSCGGCNPVEVPEVPDVPVGAAEDGEGEGCGLVPVQAEMPHPRSAAMPRAMQVRATARALDALIG
jgi:hypothetical protein